jgi:hypothetical protein
VQSELKRSWPKNLSVKHLEIVGSLNENDIENLSSIECELDLNLDCVAAEQMYQLLECKGQLVKSLTIGNNYEERWDVQYDDSDIILERILIACPNLEHFKFQTDRLVIRDDKFNLRPSAFKNYKE